MVRPTERTGLIVARDREALAHDVADAQEHVAHGKRQLSAASLQGPRRLRVRLAEPDRPVLVAGVQPGFQLGVPDRGGDRVQVRVPMSGDVDPATLDDLVGLGRHAGIIALVSSAA
jgi:hypothetical protein